MWYILMNVWGYEMVKIKAIFAIVIPSLVSFFFLSSVHSQDTTDENLQIYRK